MELNSVFWYVRDCLMNEFIVKVVCIFVCRELHNDMPCRLGPISEHARRAY